MHQQPLICLICSIPNKPSKPSSLALRETATTNQHTSPVRTDAPPAAACWFRVWERDTETRIPRERVRHCARCEHMCASL